MESVIEQIAIQSRPQHRLLSFVWEARGVLGDIQAPGVRPHAYRVIPGGSPILPPISGDHAHSSHALDTLLELSRDRNKHALIRRIVGNTQIDDRYHHLTPDRDQARVEDHGGLACIPLRVPGRRGHHASRRRRLDRRHPGRPSADHGIHRRPLVEPDHHQGRVACLAVTCECLAAPGRLPRSTRANTPSRRPPGTLPSHARCARRDRRTGIRTFIPVHP